MSEFLRYGKHLWYECSPSDTKYLHTWFRYDLNYFISHIIDTTWRISYSYWLPCNLLVVIFLTRKTPVVHTICTLLVLARYPSINRHPAHLPLPQPLHTYQRALRYLIQAHAPYHFSPPDWPPRRSTACSIARYRLGGLIALHDVATEEDSTRLQEEPRWSSKSERRMLGWISYDHDYIMSQIFNCENGKSIWCTWLQIWYWNLYSAPFKSPGIISNNSSNNFYSQIQRKGWSARVIWSA